jgi:hypothetical protein
LVLECAALVRISSTISRMSVGRGRIDLVLTRIMLLIALLASGAAAQDWTITTADFRSQPAAGITGLSGDGVRFAVAGSADDQQTIPLDRFVSAQRAAVGGAAPVAASSNAKFTLLLSNGDRLAGEPAGVVSEQLVWRSASLGELKVPMRRLTLLARNFATAAKSPSAGEPPKQDVVSLANGDTVAGVVTDCSVDKITVQTDSGPSDVPMATVTKVTFAAVGKSTASASVPRGFRVRLTDGSGVTVADGSISSDHFTAKFETTAIAVPLSQLASIEQLNGPVGWLSSLTPIESVQIPYFGGSAAISWPARNDTAVDGSPLRFKGRAFDHGVGVHAYSRLTYDISGAGGSWAAFRTQYAIDSPRNNPRPLADVTVRLRLDDKVVHERAHVRAGEVSPVVTIDLAGARKLTLEADYGDGGDTQDHLNWIEPALLRQVPATTTAPTATQP